MDYMQILHKYAYPFVVSPFLLRVPGSPEQCARSELKRPWNSLIPCMRESLVSHKGRPVSLIWAQA